MRHADTIWHSAIIETMDPKLPRAQAMAAAQGRIIAIGSDQDVLNLAGPDTKLCDMHGRYILPGLVESHSHALWGACRDLFDVVTGYQAKFDEVLEAVKSRVGQLPAGECAFGGTWRPDMRPQMGSSPRAVLDAISTVHPIVLLDITQHVVWCNTLALQMAGLNQNCVDIPGGVIEREEDGMPNGILAEFAAAPVRSLSERTPSQLAKAADHFIHYFNSQGITAFKEPMAIEKDLAAYKAADDAGALTLHMGAHLVRTSPMTTAPTPWETIERWRRDYATDNIRTGFAKLFLDGVAPSHTASFHDPYLAESGYDMDAHDPDATLLIPRDELNETVTELDRRGFVTKMHAVGDNAVEAGLDAIAAARKANKNADLRHEISHAVFVSDRDVGRFADLNAVAEISPKLWFPNPATAGQIQVLGRDRAEETHRIRDLLENGAELIYGSDWPAAAPDANPWTGLAGTISRQNHTAAFAGTLGKDQAINLAQAMPIFTINGARSLGMEKDIGSLEVNKWADFVVLDKVLTGLQAAEIAAISPRETFWKGTCVFGTS